MTHIPDEAEIQRVVFQLNSESSCCPYGFQDVFIKIVGSYVIKVMLAYFRGATLPKSFTRTKTVLSPKKGTENKIIS